jgi:hypothetical protein
MIFSGTPPGTSSQRTARMRQTAWVRLLARSRRRLYKLTGDINEILDLTPHDLPGPGQGTLSTTALISLPIRNAH